MVRFFLSRNERAFVEIEEGTQSVEMILGLAGGIGTISNDMGNKNGKLRRLGCRQLYSHWL